jgi:hypothetical protein
VTYFYKFFFFFFFLVGFEVFTAVTIKYSGMWRRVGLVRTDVSEERFTSIFRVEKFASEERC